MGRRSSAVLRNRARGRTRGDDSSCRSCSIGMCSRNQRLSRSLAEVRMYSAILTDYLMTPGRVHYACGAIASPEVPPSFLASSVWA